MAWSWNHYAGDFGGGISINSGYNETGFQWAYLMLGANLPDGINGGGALGDKEKPLFYIEGC